MRKFPLGLGMGIGIHGAATRLAAAGEEVREALQIYTAQFGPPESVIFDVFGFSRGAMLARHFVNMIHAGVPDMSAPPKEGSSPIYPDLRSEDTQGSFFSKGTGDDVVVPPPVLRRPSLEADVKIRFVGLFDSVGSFFLPGDADEGYINPHLSSSSAGFVYHLTARNEIRKNFPLTRICDELGVCPDNFLEEELFGVHADIGGGYSDKPEVFYLHDEIYFPDRVFEHGNEPYESGEKDPQWVARMKEKAARAGCKVKIERNTACFYEEHQTKPELALVALHAMLDKAVEIGVPFDSIDPPDEIPSQLFDIVKRAESKDHTAFEQLDQLYIHTSHREFFLSHFDKTIGMGASKNNLRHCFFNLPEKANVNHVSRKK